MTYINYGEALALNINTLFDQVGFWRLFLLVFLLSWVLSGIRGIFFYSTSKTDAKVNTYAPGKEDKK
jgi:hypothetical protein